MNNHGFSLTDILVASGIAVSVAFYSIQGISSQVKMTAEMERKIVAEQFASELIEYFRGHKREHLKQFLDTNPIIASAKPYPLCTHINILDRRTNKIINQDPRVELPITNIFDQGGPTRIANRFYQVQVYDIDSLQFKHGRCGKNFSDFTLSGSERFFITVGVTYTNRSRGPVTNSQVSRLVLTTLIPGV